MISDVTLHVFRKLVLYQFVVFAASYAYGSNLTVERALALVHRREALHLGAGRVQLAWVPGQHQLVYSAPSNDGAAAWILMLDINSGYGKRIIEGSCPKPSPDGSKVAFIAPARESKGINNTVIQLWMADLDGEHVIQLTNLPNGIAPLIWSRVDFEWSPDSTRIAYIPGPRFGSEDVQLPSDQIGTLTKSSAQVYPFVASSRMYRWPNDIHVVETNTLREETVLSKIRGHLAGWIDNDNLLLQVLKPGATNQADTHAEVAAFSLKTRQQKSVISGYNRQIAYSPIFNGKKDMIAFQADPGEEANYPCSQELAVYRVTNSRVTVLTTNAAITMGDWTPDGNSVLVTDGPATKRNLYAIGRTGQRREITTGVGVNSEPRFSSDGNLLAWRFTNAAHDQVIRVGTWDGQELSSVRDLVTLDQPLAGVTNAKTSAVEWHSYDNLLVDGYLTLPGNFDPSRRYPVVTILHGGPLGGLASIAYEYPGDVFLPALLADDGYVVFQPDFRGSGNLGYDKIRDAKKHGESFLRDYKDVATGIADLERKGIADPQRIFLMGHSYGSYLTNWIITHSHDFRAAISHEGGDYLSDWGGLGWFDANYSWEWYMGGPPWESIRTYHRNSAIANVKGVTIPTLFVNGGSVLADNSPAMLWLYCALKRQNIDTQYVFYPDEDHVVSRPENQEDFLLRIVSWIKSHDVN